MDIKITFETLFEMLRREKKLEELQKLDDDFFRDVIDYLKEKENLLVRQKNNPDLFSFEDERKSDNQLINIKKIIQEIYERREKKIINIALNKSKIDSDIIDTSSLLTEEKDMFEELVKHLNKYRSNIINRILQSKTPSLEKKEIKENKIEEKEINTENKNKMVRFLHSVPSFLGKELETYGPFEENDIATIPAEIVDVLIKKKRAEEIQTDGS